MEHGKPEELDPTAPFNQENNELIGVELNPDENIEQLTQRFRLANIAVQRVLELHGVDSPQYADANHDAEMIGLKLSKLHNKSKK